MRFSVMWVDETESTNADLKALAREGAPFGSVIIAKRQRGGRGRLGRSFSSENGGLYMSMLLPLKKPEDAGLLTTYAAVAAARAIESLTTLSVGIKWVNDLYVRGKKLCGILAEGVTREDGACAVLGIGVNLNNMLPNELSRIATTIKNECGQAVSPEALAEKILKEFEDHDGRDYSAHLDEYRHRCIIIGKKIDVIPHHGEKYEAMALDILPDGALLVYRLSDGERVRIFSGEVSVRQTEEP